MNKWKLCIKVGWWNNSIIIIVDSYNGNQQDALFLNCILINNSTCLGQASLADRHHTSMTNASCCEYSIKTPDDGQ